MADEQTKIPRKAATPPVVSTPETEQVGEFTLVHKGHGKYAIEGHSKEFADRKGALSYLQDLEATATFENRYGDIVPDGVEIRTRTLEYRGSLTELPMNELYLPEGGHNPFYDRAWVWGWARATGNDLSTKQARGYRLVSRDELEAETDAGRVPDHYRTLLMSIEHGARLLYGDLVLVRVPRVLWRQHQAEKEGAAFRRIKRQDETSNELLDRAGVKNVSGPISNEVSTGLKISGF